MVDGQRRGNSRLHDCIALYNTPFASAEPWPIERMRHRTDETSGSTPRQARVCIERDNVANTRKVYRGAATNRHKCGASRTAQKLVKFVQLSSLAFPAHPLAVARA